MAHEELKKQYEAELEVNPEAWRNWQLKIFDGTWIVCGNYGLGFSADSEYRRNPDAPPFPAVADYPLEDGIPPPKRHIHADLLIAIANGEQMQELYLPERNVAPSDCTGHRAGELIFNGNARYVRIKPKTRTVRVRMYCHANDGEPLLWTEQK